MSRHCPTCHRVQLSTEYRHASCGECGAILAGHPTVAPRGAHRAAPVQPFSSTGGPISNRPRQSLAAKPLATLLFLLTVGSFFMPWGVFWSIYAGFDKGSGICAHPGCQEAPTEFLKFRQVMDDESIGYCKAHIVEAPREFTFRRGKTISSAVAMVFVFGPVLFLIWFFIALGGVYQEEPRALEQCFLYVFGGLVVLNALSYGYWHYCHFAFRGSGW